jgi:hypothetical protein
MSLTDSILPYVGGLAGATVIYFIIMVVLAYSRHKREERMERSQVRTERMTRDLWLDWMRRRT